MRYNGDNSVNSGEDVYSGTGVYVQLVKFVLECRRRRRRSEVTFVGGALALALVNCAPNHSHITKKRKARLRAEEAA